MNLMKPEHMLFSQRDNENHPWTTCNVTAMCQALHILDYVFPKGSFLQPEDNLYTFLHKDSFLQKMYKESPYTRSFEPEEIHAILVEGANRWMNKVVARTATYLNRTTVERTLDEGHLILLSCRMPYFKGTPMNHIVTCTGYNDEGVFICDSYGDYHDLYANRKAVRDCFMSWEDFTCYAKPDYIEVI